MEYKKTKKKKYFMKGAYIMKYKNKKNLGAYVTYALAEKEKVDKDTKTARPSDFQVEEMRDFCIENKK